jgi:acetate kinase
MGLTPLEGVVMGTRSGDLDPSIVIYLIEERECKPPQITELLNKKSGLLGLCGRNDMRDIIERSR